VRIGSGSFLQIKLKNSLKCLIDAEFYSIGHSIYRKLSAVLVNITYQMPNLYLKDK
jgi:hypothetical protein